MRMLLKAGFSASEVEQLVKCLVASRDGAFFDEAEFHTLFGIDRSKLDDVINAWPEVNLEDTEVCLALNNSLGNLIGYPHGLNTELEESWGVKPDQLTSLFEKWRTVRLGDSS